jgi:hypothetical protein
VAVPRNTYAPEKKETSSFPRKTGPTRFALFLRQFYVIFASARVFAREDPLERKLKRSLKGGSRAETGGHPLPGSG